MKDLKTRSFVALFLGGVLTLTVAAFYGGPRRKAPPREIELVATRVAFQLAGHPDKPNPPVTLKKGQPVKLVIRNADPEKILHCFSVGGLNVKTTRSLEGGEAETLHFTPAKKGTFVYACLMHPSMAGKLIVE